VPASTSKFLKILVNLGKQKMSSAPAMTLSSLAAQAYLDGYAFHGDIDLQPERFENQLWAVIEKHLGSNASDATTLSFFSTLHTTDLYLTVACSPLSERAWARFGTAYQRYIDKVARAVSPTSDAARDLASDVTADLFMPDRSGHSRIASFDGQQSLATWLRVLISHRATNARMLKWNSCERIERLSDVADVGAVTRMETALSAKKYEAILADCFKLASESLTDRERLTLLWRYDDGLRICEIAGAFDVDPSSITRQLQKTHLKLQKKIISVLTLKYRLGPAAIKECVVDLLENPAHSLLVFLKASASRHTGQTS
jgi:RNA polymerase sigma factor (sigma-70 family)